MRDDDPIQRLAREAAAGCGVEVVEVSVARSSRRWRVRVDIDRAGRDGVTVDDCQAVSRALEAALDREDPISASYTLEVSSPGLDRPIVTPEDYRRNTGRKVRIETVEDLDGRRSFVGTLEGLDGDAVRLLEDDARGERLIPLAGVSRTRQYVPF